MYGLLYLGAAAVNETQMTAISTALTNAASTVLDTFIGLLPIIGLIVGVSFAISFVSGKFRKIERKKA